MEISPEILNGLAGLAALVNSLLMWPTVKALKRIAEDHGARITTLEQTPKKRKPRGRV